MHHCLKGYLSMFQKEQITTMVSAIKHKETAILLRNYCYCKAKCFSRVLMYMFAIILHGLINFITIS